MTYAEAMRRFGSDKPDLRNPLELVEVADLFRGRRVQGIRRRRRRIPRAAIAALRLPRGGELTRKEIDDYTRSSAATARRDSPISRSTTRKARKAGLQSPILKFLPDAAVEGVLERVGAVDGDLVFFGADKAKVVNDALGALQARARARPRAARRRLAARSGSSIFRCSRRVPDGALDAACITRSRRRAVAVRRRVARESRRRSGAARMTSC